MLYTVKCATCGVPRQYEELRKALAAETSNCKSCAAKDRVRNPSPKMRAAHIAQAKALAAKRKGVPLSEEHREKCAAKQRLNPANKGTVWNAEQRRSLSEKMKGQSVSAETRARRKASMHKHYGTEPSPSRITRVEYIEDHYAVSYVEHLFRTREIAEKWIEKETLREAVLREARARSNEITNAWCEANPFVFDEEKPKRAPRWPSGIRQSDITPEMRAVREAANKLRQEYWERYGAAQTAHYVKRDAHLSAVWAEEGHAVDVTKRIYVPSEPTEYNITEMPVLETDDLEDDV